MNHVRSVASGEREDGGSVEEVQQRRAVMANSRLAPHGSLTPRQRQIADLIVLGLSDKEIAARLNLRVNTVRCHMRNVRAALGVHSHLHVAVSVLETNN